MRRYLWLSGIIVALAPTTSRGQSAPSRDTLHIEVGSPHVNGRIYREHVARVLVQHSGPGAAPTSHWTNTLTLGDSAGRPVQRWISAGAQGAPGASVSPTWELYQNYDQETLAPYSYYFKATSGAETRLVIDGPRIRGTKRASANAPIQQVDITLPRAAFMQNASDLVPLAVGLREGRIMTAPMWNPGTSEFNVRVFIVRAQMNMDVEGTMVRAWPVEERTLADKLISTWYLIEQAPYMVAGEVPLPNGGVQRMTEVSVPIVAPRSQSAADSAAIRATALDYVEGWYEGNAERMGRAVHPELVKRIIARDTVSGRSWISNQGSGNLVAGTARGGGKSTPMDRRRKDIQILDIYGTVASVRATMSGWIDYMHMAKVDGRWQIVNVLWELHPPGR